jgi:phosphoribosylaminoimidazolecarboxamide formyltransferase/IMP cyclohydrolase
MDDVPVGPDSIQQPPRALVSVWDKTGIVDFCTTLVEFGWEIISTGGTAELLRTSNVPVCDVSEVTGHPEVFDGRVKTLHPAIHAPLLARRDNQDDCETLQDLGYLRIDLVAVNLYPFEQVAEREPAVELEELIEMVDIGGPTLLRAAAKNHRDVLVICDPSQYSEFLIELDRAAGVPESIQEEFRQAAALAVFQLTASYDFSVATTLETRFSCGGGFPATLLTSGSSREDLRYGENPHQQAAFYDASTATTSSAGLAAAKQYSGKELSYNNYLDLDTALSLCRNLSGSEWGEQQHACVIVKHNNPCGAAISTTQRGAWEDALASDPESAFGCVIAFNQQVDEATAESIGDHFVECLIAPSFSSTALLLLEVKQNRRLLALECDGDKFLPVEDGWALRQVAGGWLAQSSGTDKTDWEGLESVTKSPFSLTEIQSARFGVEVCRSVMSNSIVLIQGTRTVGIGPGQTSRVESVRIAVRRAADEALGSLMVSDAFFPFRDGLDAAAQAGVTHVVQPGGSIRDAEVISAADGHGMAMVFTGLRLFRH